MVLPFWNTFFHTNLSSVWKIIGNFILTYGKSLLPPRKSHADLMRGGGEGKGKGFFKLTRYCKSAFRLIISRV
jgi:hypothetical protein